MKKYDFWLFLVLVGLLIGVIYIQNYSIAVLIQGVKIQENSLYVEILQTQRYVANLLIAAISGVALLLLAFTWLINEKLVERKIDEAISKLEKKYTDAENKNRANMENTYFNLGRTHALLALFNDNLTAKAMYGELAIFFFNTGSYDGPRVEIVLKILLNTFGEMKKKEEKIPLSTKSRIIERLDKLNPRHNEIVNKIKEVLEEISLKKT